MKKLTLVTTILILIIFFGCKKDRYVLAYDVRIESSEFVVDHTLSGNNSCVKTSYTTTVKRGKGLNLNMYSCKGIESRVTVKTGKKVWYDKTGFTHKETIVFK